MPYKYSFSSFTDDEVKDIIKEGIKHYRNPKHCHSQFGCEKSAIEIQFIEYNTRPKTDEEINRLWELYDEVLSTLEE